MESESGGEWLAEALFYVVVHVVQLFSQSISFLLGLNNGFLINSKASRIQPKQLSNHFSTFIIGEIFICQFIQFTTYKSPFFYFSSI